MVSVVVETAPEPVVNLADAKQHLKVSHSAEDALITGMVAAATQTIDGPAGWLGRAIGVQTLVASLPTWAVAASFRLPYPPLIDVESITYRDAKRQTVTIDPDSYEVIDGLVEAIGAASWAPARAGKNGLRVRYRAGYEEVPAPIRVAILMMVGDLYRNRETIAAVAMTKVPMAPTVEALLNPFRIYSE